MLDTDPGLPDLTTPSDEWLTVLGHAVEQELAKRRTLRDAPALIDQITDQYQRALGRETGAGWAQPTGAHDAYGEGAVVTYDGALWRSVVPGNVWSPTDLPSAWELAEDAVTEPQPDADPWTAGIAYTVGDLVDYQGTVYRVIQAHTSAAHWLPDAVPSLYVTA